MRVLVLSIAVFARGVISQQTGWGQCGGQGWAGTSTCPSGWTCTYSNPWYSQCLPRGSTSSTITSSTIASRPTSTSSTSQLPSTPTGVGKFKWLGVNEGGAEFGQDTYPRTWGRHFIFPDTSAVGTLISEGYNIFRIPFAMERMVQSGVSSSLNSAYLQNLTTVVDYITSRGAYAILDPHNFGRYHGAVITDTAAFKSFWTKLAGAFASNAKVVFDTNNEYNQMDQTLVLNLNQAGIDGIRAAGATSQYIFVEGNSWTGAWTWNTTNTNLASLADPQDKIVYEMHQYLDTDGSGTSAACVSSNIGIQRVVGATDWLKQNRKVGILGEFAAGPNTQCRMAVQGMLDHLAANSDVWLGALWWSAGPWWADYMYGFEPPGGVAYQYYDSLLTQYAP